MVLIVFRLSNVNPIWSDLFPTLQGGSVHSSKQTRQQQLSYYEFQMVAPVEGIMNLFKISCISNGLDYMTACVGCHGYKLEV